MGKVTSTFCKKRARRRFKYNETSKSCNSNYFPWEGMKKTAVWVYHISVEAKIGVFPRMLIILRKDDMAKFPSYIIENEKHPCFYGTLVPNFPTPPQLEPNEIGEIEPNLFTAVIILSPTILHIIPWGWTVHKHPKTEQEITGSRCKGYPASRY